MSMTNFTDRINSVIAANVKFDAGENFIFSSPLCAMENQAQTNDAFSTKWSEYEKTEEKESYYEMQRQWYLKLYGFENEADLASYLQSKHIIYDAGCGLGFKAFWFAKLAPQSVVVAMDYSEAAQIGAHLYKEVPNLFFIRGDIAESFFKPGVIDYVSCDQVIMHTENPDKTFAELSKIVSPEGEFACYFYAKKALPRELLDDYFRLHCKSMTHDELQHMSAQIADFGKYLSDLKIELDVPPVDALGIQGGKIDLQRFFYWNFLKCYWNDELGYDTSVMVNYDWYSPSNARRYSEDEVKDLVNTNLMEIVYFHKEEACYSGRFQADQKQIKAAA